MKTTKRPKRRIILCDVIVDRPLCTHYLKKKSLKVKITFPPLLLLPRLPRSIVMVITAASDKIIDGPIITFQYSG